MKVTFEHRKARGGVAFEDEDEEDFPAKVRFIRLNPGESDCSIFQSHFNHGWTQMGKTDRRVGTRLSGEGPSPHWLEVLTKTIQIAKRSHFLKFIRCCGCVICFNFNDKKRTHLEPKKAILNPFESQFGPIFGRASEKQSHRLVRTGDWKVASTGSLERLPYMGVVISCLS